MEFDYFQKKLRFNGILFIAQRVFFVSNVDYYFFASIRSHDNETKIHALFFCGFSRFKSTIYHEIITTGCRDRSIFVKLCVCVEFSTMIKTEK